mgnify:CR=1 FL=1
MSERDWGWVEGMIDGEGCLGLYLKKYNESGRAGWAPRLVISGTNLEMIKEAKKILGGKGHITSFCHAPARPCYNLTLTPVPLRDILPKLKLKGKQRQCRLVLEALELLKEHVAYHTPNDKRLKEIRKELMRLNGGIK